MKQRKGRQRDKQKTAKRQQPTPPAHRQAFDQLLDDAIFGVQKKAAKPR